VKGRNVAVESARENATETGIAVSLSKGDDLGREREGGGVDRAHREEKREDAAKNGSEKSSTKTLIGVRVKRIERENGIETGTVNADVQNLERKIVNVSVREGKDVKENVVKGWNISRQMMEEKCELRKNPLMVRIPTIVCQQHTGHYFLFKFKLSHMNDAKWFDFISCLNRLSILSRSSIITTYPKRFRTN
jgi:hypothetical protein